MSEIIARLRYHPGDNLRDITRPTLDQVARKRGVRIATEEHVGKDRVNAGHTVFERTWDVPFEQVSQTVITVSASDGEAMRNALRDLIRLYRSPVPIWGCLGSTPEGERIAKQVMEEDDGW